MELSVPCGFCNPAIHRSYLSSKPDNRYFSFLKCRRKTVSELQTQAGVNGRTSLASSSAPAPAHKVTVHDRQRGVTHEFLVPEDQYILHTAESQNITLPFACRHDILHGYIPKILLVFQIQELCQSYLFKVTKEADTGCCTSCAVRVKSGQIRQPEALGISAELKSKGYALLCVGFPTSNLEVETQDEDEVYWLQFGRYFARGPVERDDYALELAMGDE